LETEAREKTARAHSAREDWQRYFRAMLHSELFRTTRRPKTRQPRIQPMPRKE
jgi:hypothetical protein